MTEKTKLFRVDINRHTHPEAMHFCINSTLEAAKENIAAWLESVQFCGLVKVRSNDLIYDKIQAVIYHPDIPVDKVKFICTEEYI